MSSLSLFLCLFLSVSVSVSPLLHLRALLRNCIFLRARARSSSQLRPNVATIGTWVCAWRWPPRSSATTTTRFSSIHGGWMKIGGDDGNPNPKAGRKAGQADETFLLPTYQLLNMYGTNLTGKLVFI